MTRRSSLIALLALAGCGPELASTPSTGPVAVQQAQPMTLSPEQLAHSVRLRTLLGFANDPRTLETLQLRPADLRALWSPDAETFDLVLTPAELERLQNRQRLQNVAREVVRRASAASPEFYAGASIDLARDGEARLTVRFAGTVDPDLQSRLTRVMPAELQPRLDVLEVHHSLRYLRRVQTMLTGELEGITSDELRITSSEIDERANQVVLYVTGDVEAVQKFVLREGFDDAVRVESLGDGREVLEGWSKTAYLPEGRVGAGQRIELVSQTDVMSCTSGFAVRDDHRNYVLTAGHCWRVGGRYAQGGQPLGHPLMRSVAEGFDALAIDVTDDRPVWSRIHRNTQNWALPVSEAVELDADVVGSLLCQAGQATTGNLGNQTPSGRCGVLEARFYDPGQGFEPTFRRGGYESTAGDSGAPLWADVDGKAVAHGLHRGCWAMQGQACKPGFRIYSHLPQVLETWGLRLVPE